ncbi:MAG: N-acetyltransferase [Leptolyngbyaceae cyanobacterium CRU_2_3]|nr:N-acetyltransferase [Leptolyngbyaceae cyanobacterium CRU_2_3]
MNIRDAQEFDLPAIVAIYNAAIPTRISTADLEPITVESRRAWFHQYNPQKRPLWVLEIDQKIAAWINLTSFYSGRPAYSATAEISIYIAPQYQRQGYGKLLVKHVIEACPRLGVTTLLAMYFDHNMGSRQLFESLGFQSAGHLSEIAVLDGQQRGLIIAIRRVEPTPLSIGE